MRTGKKETTLQRAGGEQSALKTGVMAQEVKVVGSCKY